MEWAAAAWRRMLPQRRASLRNERSCTAAQGSEEAYPSSEPSIFKVAGSLVQVEDLLQLDHILICVAAGAPE